MATAKHLGIAVIGFLATSASISTPTRATSLPPAEGTAKARLNGSPRHAELATVDVRGTPVRVWVVYPERKDAAPAVIVIHEIFGLTDWIRAVADQLAADGFIAVAPDLLSGKGPGGGGTDAYPSRDDVTKAVSGLARDEVIARLDAVRDWALARPAANGKSASLGFCWGGSTSFAWAVAQPDVTIQVWDKVLPVRARTGTPEDKRRVWPIMTAQWPAYDEYQAGSRRNIPVVLLTPR